MRTVNSVRNPVYADPTGFRINLEVDFDHLDEVYVPFTAYSHDCEPHSVDLYNRAIAGEFGPIASFTPPADRTGDEALNMIRSDRDQKLVETDFVENPTFWARLSTEKQTEWTNYRNALRDLPSTVVDPVFTCTVVVDPENDHNYITTWTPNFSWPVKPA